MTPSAKEVLEGRVAGGLEVHLRLLEEDTAGYMVRVLAQVEVGGLGGRKKDIVLALMKKGEWEWVEEVLAKGKFRVGDMKDLCTVLDSRRRKKAIKRSLDTVSAKNEKDSLTSAVSKWAQSASESAAARFNSMNHVFQTRPTRASPSSVRSDAEHLSGGGTVPGKGRPIFGAPTARGFLAKRALPRIGHRYSYIEPKVKRRCFKAASLSTETDRIDSVVATKPTLDLTLSGSVCRHLKTWFTSLPASTLEHALLEQSTATWRSVARLLHANPSDMQLPEFLPCLFEPKRTRPANLEYCLRLTETKLQDLSQVVMNQPPVSYLKKKFETNLPAATRLAVAAYTSIEDCISWYSTLRCAGVDDLLEERLASGDWPVMSYGVLLERLLYLSKNKAHKLLASLLPVVESKVREEAFPVRDSTLILCECAPQNGNVASYKAQVMYSAMLSLLSGGELKFYSPAGLVSPHIYPVGVKDALIMAEYSQILPALKKCDLVAALEAALGSTEPISNLVILEGGNTVEDSVAELVKKIAAHKAAHSPDLHVVLVVFGEGGIPLLVSLQEHDVPVSLHTGDQYLATFDDVVTSLVRCSDHYECAVRVLRGFQKELPKEQMQCLVNKLKHLSDGTVMEIVEEGLHMMNDSKEVRFKAALKEAAKKKVLQNVGEKMLDKKVVSVSEMKRDLEFWHTGPVERTWRVPETPPGLEVLDVQRLVAAFAYLDGSTLHIASKVCKAWRYFCMETDYDKKHQIPSWPEHAMQKMADSGLVFRFGKKLCWKIVLKHKGDTEAATRTLFRSYK